MKTTLKRITAAVLVGATVLALTACGNGGKMSFTSTKTDREAVMTVGGSKVEYQEFRYYFLNNKRDAYGADAVLTAEQTAEILALTEDNIRSRHGLLLLADKYGTGVTDADLNEAKAYAEDYRANLFNSDEDYLLALAENFLTHELFLTLQSENMLPYTVLNKMKESGDIKTDEETINAAFVGEDILCLKEVYVNKSKYSDENAALERAEEAEQKLMDGVPFEDVMREYSDYDAASLPPEHGYYTMKYDALDVIWDTASGLAEGEYSYIIESEYGYHIVLRAPKDIPYMNEIRDSIIENYCYAKFGEIFYPFAEGLEIEYTEFGKGIDVSNLQ